MWTLYIVSFIRKYLNVEDKHWRPRMTSLWNKFFIWILIHLNSVFHDMLWCRKLVVDPKYSLACSCHKEEQMPIPQQCKHLNMMIWQQHNHHHHRVDHHNHYHHNPHQHHHEEQPHNEKYCPMININKIWKRETYWFQPDNLWGRLNPNVMTYLIIYHVES